MESAPNQLHWYQSTLKQYLTSEELKLVMRKSNVKATVEVAHTWVWIVAALGLVDFFPNLFTIIISLFIIGGKQLACAIIMHDASHDSLFTSRRANELVGNWLGAYPIWHNLEQYRPYHRAHHINTGLETDPDLNLTRGYPTTPISMFRKIARDLAGATGIKAQLGVIAMHLGIIQYNLAGIVKRLTSPQRIKISIKNLAGPFLSNLIIALICLALGAPWLYLLWIGSLLTTYPFCLRVRSIAEHSVVSDQTDPQSNTRTTYANFIERMLFAPHYVNYHAEHHLCMGAPPYNLPQMHQLLKAKGFYDRATLAPSYLAVMRQAMSR